MTLKKNWAAGEAFTASDANDVATAVNALSAIVSGAATAFVGTQEGTTSSSYTDLTTTTDTVTVTVGASGKAVVFLSAQLQNSGFICYAWVGFAISGASTAAANDAQAIMYQNVYNGGSPQAQYGSPYLLTGLSPGSTTFKLKYKATGGGTAQFTNRAIAVIPL
jgi:hypothetical protein